MTTKQQLDIAVRALEYYADHKVHATGTQARIALATIYAMRDIAAQASTVAQDERGLFIAAYMAMLRDMTHNGIQWLDDGEKAARAWNGEAGVMYRAGRASVAVPAAQGGQQCIQIASDLSKIESLARTLRMRADALGRSGDEDLEGIGEHYTGIAGELDAALAAVPAAQPVGEAVAWAVESNIGDGIRCLTRVSFVEVEIDRWVSAYQAQYAGSQRKKVPLYRAAPPVAQAITESSLTAAAQSCLSPDQFEHFEALRHGDTLDRFASAISKRIAGGDDGKDERVFNLICAANDVINTIHFYPEDIVPLRKKSAMLMALEDSIQAMQAGAKP